MLAVYRGSRRPEPRLEAALRGRPEVVRSTRWREFARLAAGAECAVIFPPRPRWSADAARIAALRARFPFLPLVVVIRRDAEGLRRLRRVRVEEVVWLRDVEKALAGAIDRARSHAFLARMAARFEAAEGLGKWIRRALALACRTVPPIRGIGQLAQAAGCGRSTLWTEWMEAMGEGAGEKRTLKRFLSWIQLIRAVAHRPAAGSWEAVATEIGISRHTLGRRPKALLGCDLSDLTPGDPQPVARCFQKEMVRPLLPGEVDLPEGPDRLLRG